MADEVRDRAGAHGAAQPRTTVALEPGFDFLSREYRELFKTSGATAFQHPVWLDAFYRTMTAPHGAEKLIITGRDQKNGALLFLLPLLRRRRSGVAVIEAAHLGVGDYAHPAVSPDLPTSGLASAVAAVLPAHDVINIRPIREEALPLWSAFLSGRPSALDYSSHAAELSTPFTGWRAKAYEPSFAKYLDRKKRRFLKSGKVELLRVDSDFSGAVDLIASIRAGRFEDDILQTGFARKFYAEVAANGRDFARIYQLKLDGADVAQAFGLVLGKRFYYLLIGADYEHFGKHSPGLVLYDLLIEEWINEGGTVFDFTIGDEAFKRDFGTTPTPIHALVETKTLRGRLALTAFDAMRGLRKWKAEAKPEAVLRSMGETVRSVFVKTAIAAFLARPIAAEFVGLV